MPAILRAVQLRKDRLQRVPVPVRIAGSTRNNAALFPGRTKTMRNNMGSGLRGISQAGLSIKKRRAIKALIKEEQ